MYKATTSKLKKEVIVQTAVAANGGRGITVRANASRQNESDYKNWIG